MVQDFILKQKQDYLQVLMSKYEKAYKQLSSTLNESDKPSIETQIKQLENQIQKVLNEIAQIRLNPEKGRELATKARQEEEIANRVKEENKTQTIIEHKQKVAERAQEDSLDFFSAVYREYNQKWEENLHEINFSQATPIIQTNLERLKNQSGYSLFLLKESTSMGGDWCLQIIKSFLRGMGTLHRHIPKFKFKSLQPKNNREFLNYLAEKFEIEPAVFNESNNIQKYTKNIIDGICKSLYSGNIVFIDVEIPSLGREDRFLVWFVEQLWNQLISRLDQLSNTHCLIRVVGVIAVHSGVPEECLPRYLCYERRAENLDGTRFLEIPLETWTEQEIRNWLINFSGLTAPNIGLSIPEIDAIARSIFEVSNGAPDRAYRELKEQLKDVIQDKFKQYEGNN